MTTNPAPPAGGRATILGMLILLVVAGGALAGSAWLLWVSYENLQSGSWPRTEGTVESLRLLQKTGTRSLTQFIVEIRYTFQVNGVVDHGDRFNTRGDYLPAGGDASVVAKTYKPGSPCSVAYDPKDPRRCFIDTSVTWHTYGKLAIGVVLGLFGLFVLYHGLKDFIPGRR